MKVIRNIFGILLLASFIVACAGTTRRGSVVMKLNESEAHISMGQGDVNVGDHVELYRNICTSTRNDNVGERHGGGKVTCEKKLYGHGEVSQLLGNDYALVKFPAGVAFAEGDTVEKHSH
jgi:hypothetical protein